MNLLPLTTTKLEIDTDISY